jgi:hypothetical protein
MARSRSISLRFSSFARAKAPGRPFVVKDEGEGVFQCNPLSELYNQKPKMATVPACRAIFIRS